MPPVERAFARVERALRRRGARSWALIVAASGETLATVSDADARACFADAGFPSFNSSASMGELTISLPSIPAYSYKSPLDHAKGASRGHRRCCRGRSAK